MSSHHKTRRAKRFRRFAAIVVLVVMLAGGVVGIDWVLSNIRADQQIVSSNTTAVVQSADINIFRTPYYQFQTDRSWREVSSDEGEDVFLYRSFDGPLVQHELRIEINGGIPIILDNTQVSRVLPATISNNRLSTDSTISPHCKEVQENELNQDQLFVEYEQVTFPCNPDSSIFSVVVGEVGGGYYFEKPTFEGVRTMKIIYRDSTFTPTGRPLRNIINTFQVL